MRNYGGKKWVHLMYDIFKINSIARKSIFYKSPRHGKFLNCFIPSTTCTKAIIVQHYFINSCIKIFHLLKYHFPEEKDKRDKIEEHQNTKKNMMDWASNLQLQTQCWIIDNWDEVLKQEAT